MRYRLNFQRTKHKFESSIFLDSIIYIRQNIYKTEQGINRPGPFGTVLVSFLGPSTVANKGNSAETGLTNLIKASVFHALLRYIFNIFSCNEFISISRFHASIFLHVNHQCLAGPNEKLIFFLCSYKTCISFSSLFFLQKGPYTSFQSYPRFKHVCRVSRAKHVDLFLSLKSCRSVPLPCFSHMSGSLPYIQMDVVISQMNREPTKSNLTGSPSQCALPQYHLAT